MSQTIKFNTTGVAPTAEEISKLELALGHKLPEDFACKIRDLSWGLPKPNILNIEGNDVCSIDMFIPFDELISYQNMLKERDDLSSLLPFARASFGDFLAVVIDRRLPDFGCVYLVDHETANPKLVAGSVVDLMTCIRPFDPSGLDDSRRILGVTMTSEGMALLEKLKTQK